MEHQAVRIHTYRAVSHHTLPALAAALTRAVFLLRNEGNGAYDAQQAEVLESILLKEKME